jgi:probable F420-dependent oxidoreductase
VEVRDAMQLGVKLPHTGAAVAVGGLPERARALEAAGFDSLWVSDHVVFPVETTSWYPFAADGRPTWPADTPYVETVVALAVAAASTERIRIGTAVLVVPQRNPLLLAKQLASVAHVSGGRLEVGIGAGWLREEFEALDAPFGGRGARMVEWVDIMRACWTGRPDEYLGKHYHLPADLVVLPAPPAPVPIYVGGHSPLALRRAATIADGWLGQQAADAFDTALLADEVAAVRRAADAADRDRSQLRVVLRVVNSAGRAAQVAAQLGALGKAGVDEVIVDVDPLNGDPVTDHDILRDAAEST